MVIAVQAVPILRWIDVIEMYAKLLLLTRVLSGSEGGEYELLIRRRDGSPVYEFTVPTESQ